MATGTVIKSYRQHLKSEHKRVAQLQMKLEEQYLTLMEKLNIFAEDYMNSGEHFPWSRSKLLDEMVDSITADSIMHNLLVCVKESKIASEVTEQPKGGAFNPIQKSKSINYQKYNCSMEEKGYEGEDHIGIIGEGQTEDQVKDEREGQDKGQGQVTDTAEGQTKGQRLREKRSLLGKKTKKKFVKRIKSFNVFHVGPVEDEDVMTNERLEFCRNRKERHIRTLHRTLAKLHTALVKLSKDYSAARAQFMCCGYCRKTRIIETALEEMNAFTVIES